MLFHPLCYLKRALFRLENYPGISKAFFVVNSTGSKTLSVMPGYLKLSKSSPSQNVV